MTDQKESGVRRLMQQLALDSLASDAAVPPFASGAGAVPPAAASHAIVLVKFITGGAETAYLAEVPVAMSMTAIAMLKMVKQHEVFGSKLALVDLTECKVTVAASSSKRKPTRDEEETAATMEGAETLQDFIKPVIKDGAAERTSTTTMDGGAAEDSKAFILAVKELARQQAEATKDLVRQQAEATKELARQQAEAAKELARQQAEAALAAQKQSETIISSMAATLQSKVGIASTTKLAHTSLEALQAMPGGVKLVSDLVASVPISGGHAVLTKLQQDELQRLASAGKEVDVVRYLTPHLARLRLPPAQSSVSAAADLCAPVLVNSEEFQWLVHPATRSNPKLNEKPDLFHSWRPFVAFREGKERQAQDSQFSFGRLADYRLQAAGCVREIYEAKKEFTDSDFGELCAYHLCIEGPCFGMLFDSTRFWLYKSMHGLPLHLIQGTWTEPGGDEAVRAFFKEVPEPELLTLLRRLLADLKTPLCFIERPLENKTMERRAHLGSGGYGHVFAVGDATRPSALKVILTPSSVRVAQEYHLLESAAHIEAPVIPPVPGSLRTYENGGGYLLEEVGKPFTVANKTQCREAFAALALLHSKRITHGDPRLANLLRCRSGPRWIDPALFAQNFDDPEHGDMKVLATSVLNLQRVDQLPDPVKAAIANYAAASSVSVAAVADAVWTASK